MTKDVADRFPGSHWGMSFDQLRPPWDLQSPPLSWRVAVGQFRSRHLKGKMDSLHGASRSEDGVGLPEPPRCPGNWLRGAPRHWLPITRSEMAWAMKGDVTDGVVSVLTGKEAARRLKVSTATAYELCEGGKLAYTRVSTRSMRILEGDLAAYVRSTRVRSERA